MKTVYRIQHENKPKILSLKWIYQTKSIVKMDCNLFVRCELLFDLDL